MKIEGMRRFALPITTGAVFLVILCFSRCALAISSIKGNLQSPASSFSIASAQRAKAQRLVEKASSLRQRLTRRNLNSAITLLINSAALFKAANFFTDASDSYRNTGDIYFQLSQYEKAESMYGEALKVAGENSDRRCLAFSHMMRTYSSLGKTSKVENWEQTLSLCEKSSIHQVSADAMESHGEVLYWAQDTDNARPLLEQAQNSFAALKDIDGQALTSLMLAYSSVANNPSEAARLAREALRQWYSIGNVWGVARARLALGSFAGLSDQFETVQCNCSSALKVFHAISDSDNEAIALNILGALSRETGDTESSLDYYQRAKAAFKVLGDELGEADTVSGIGTALTLMGRRRGLLTLYQEKLRLAKHAKSPGLIASAYADLAKLAESQHRYAIAESHYQNALETYCKAGNTFGQGSVLIYLALLQAEQGKNAEAIASLENARILKEQTKQAEDLAKIEYELAWIYERMGKLNDALAGITRTIDIVESQRLRIFKFDSRASYFAAVHGYYSLYIQILMELHRQHPDKDYLERAFEASERSKVRSLLDLLTASPQNVSCDELLKRDLLPDEVGSEAANVPAATAGLALTLKEVQAQIADDDVLVEYALGDERSYAWVVTRSQIASYDLPPAKHIEKLVKSFISSLVPPEPHKDETVSEYEKRVRGANGNQRVAQELARFLIGQLSLPSGKRVLIVPDGDLQRFPFAALPLSAKSRAGTAFVASHEIVVLPSASALGALRKKAEQRSSPPSGAVVFADPVFTSNPSGTFSAPKPESRSRALDRALRDVHGRQYIEDLPGSRQEALTIEKILGKENVHLALKYDANRQSVLSGQLSGYRYIHFATHGLLDARHPEMSGLILSLVDSRGRPRDGYLRMGDIYNLKLTADLVVLSSCESALGKELQSEGIIGLPRAFLYAGARSVIATLWKVDDDATAVLMEAFYRRIKAGDPPSMALHRAQLDMIKHSRYSAPRYWAAFVLQGDYK